MQNSLSSGSTFLVKHGATTTTTLLEATNKEVVNPIYQIQNINISRPVSLLSPCKKKKEFSIIALQSILILKFLLPIDTTSPQIFVLGSVCENGEAVCCDS